MPKLPFKPITRPHLYGRYLEGPDGLQIEVVRCYAGEWDVFITRGDSVVACSIDRHKMNHRYLTHGAAIRVARLMYESVVAHG